MAKKIRFPLKLADGIQARTLEDLQEHFDLESVLGHYKSGKLITWLEDRYLEGEAEAIRALDESASDFQRRLCEIFGVEYVGDDADMETVQLRQERLAKLRTITDEQEFIDHIDQIAFDQEELADLLDEDTTTIYLCGEKFTVPASRKGITYIGIENPAVHISGKLPKTADKLEITFVKVQCDNLPPVPAASTTSEHTADTYSSAELPPEPIFGGGVLTESYWLYPVAEASEDEDDDDEIYSWYRFELAARNTVKLPEKLADILTECKNSNIGNVFTANGDEILCRNHEDEVFYILNLRTGKLEPHYDWGELIVFNSEFIAIYDSDDFGTINIIDRKDPRKHKLLNLDEDSDDNRGLFLDDDLLKSNIEEIEKAMILINSRLYFVIEHYEGAFEYWLVCFDIKAKKLTVVVEIEDDIDEIVAGNEKFLYLYESDSDSDKLWSVDLGNSSVNPLVDTMRDMRHDFQMEASGDYLVWRDPNGEAGIPRGRGRKTVGGAFASIASASRAIASLAESLGEMQFDIDGTGKPAADKANLFTVELSTGKVKAIQFHLEQEEYECAIMQVYRSMFYCCQPEDWAKAPGERIGYKFDLSSEALEAVKFNF